ncbi:hypothetical protein LWI29_031971 [Acer saccharum]|uniref:Protein kinase domain-containing protein n=1 Tax=Acer saccharum TaxID=4024 RepID=A0AA39T7P2_ACESA|nr:hypothetical protein LWI29_031971 [Acer saccharum]
MASHRRSFFTEPNPSSSTTTKDLCICTSSNHSSCLEFPVSCSSAGKSQFSDVVEEENPMALMWRTLSLKEFSSNDLKIATNYFKPASLLGEGRYGRVFKGWVDEKTLASSSMMGIGMAVAVKALNNGTTLQGFQDWQNYNPKISDFGLVKLGPSGDKTHVSTRMLGTYGYAAPEYFETGHLTVKSDVYSFGIVLLELLTGLRAADLRRRTNNNLVKCLEPMLSQPKTLMDVRMKGQYSLEAARNATQLTLKCLEVNHKNRPSMKEVLEVLVQIEAMTSMKEDPEVLEQIEAVTSMTEDPEVLEHIEAIDEKPKNTNYRSR